MADRDPGDLVPQGGDGGAVGAKRIARACAEMDAAQIPAPRALLGGE